MRTVFVISYGIQSTKNLHGVVTDSGADSLVIPPTGCGSVVVALTVCPQTILRTAGASASTFIIIKIHMVALWIASIGFA